MKKYFLPPLGAIDYRQGDADYKLFTINEKGTYLTSDEHKDEECIFK